MLIQIDELKDFGECFVLYLKHKYGQSIILNDLFNECAYMDQAFCTKHGTMALSYQFRRFLVNKIGEFDPDYLPVLCNYSMKHKIYHTCTFYYAYYFKLITLMVDRLNIISLFRTIEELNKQIGDSCNG